MVGEIEPKTFQFEDDDKRKMGRFDLSEFLKRQLHQLEMERSMQA